MAGHDRYRLLDELRGIAAVGVLVFHIGTRGGGPALLPNGFLAVDFFFMLSGFVIAEAYEQRLLAGMALRDFAARRLIRMAPVAMLGALLGGAYLLARHGIAPGRSDPLGELIAGNALNLLMLPKLWHGPATGWELFPANGPLWSLFFEIVINFVWAATLTGRSARTLALWVIASGAALVVCGLHAGSLDLGWQATSLAGGLARVSFGFGVGLLLHRGRRFLPRMGGAAAWAALVALLYFLALPLHAVGWSLVVVLVCLPAVLAVAIAAGDCAVLPAGAFLGRLSYPLYGVHVPLIAVAAGAIKHAGGGAAGGWTMLLLVPLALSAAWAVLIGWDEPIRAELARRSARGRPRRGAAEPVQRSLPYGPGAGTCSEVNLSVCEGTAATA
jgi:peptidoglycan/LPS O-acetylase OafA/YrhL